MVPAPLARRRRSAPTLPPRPSMIKISSAFDAGCDRGRRFGCVRRHTPQYSLRFQRRVPAMVLFSLAGRRRAGLSHPSSRTPADAPMSTAGRITGPSRRTTIVTGSACRRAFDGERLVISHVPERDSVYYAYFEPYSWERHLDLLGRAEASPLARVSDLGSTRRGPRHESHHRRRHRVRTSATCG